MLSAVELLNEVIAELESRLHLKAGQVVTLDEGEATTVASASSNKSDGGQQSSNCSKPPKREKQSPALPNEDQPEICKLEFKVGVITKVWVHEKAEKLYCEEIDVSEDEPRQIASGLRPHYTEEQMLGQRLLVISNLKAKNLLGFKSHGMVLCAAESLDGEEGHEKVEFIEPPEKAAIGELVTFDGLPPPQPFSAAQVDKKKVFQACLEGMRTADDCTATWNGHSFLTSAGPCKSKTIKNCPMR